MKSKAYPLEEELNNGIIHQTCGGLVEDFDHTESNTNLAKAQRELRRRIGSIIN